MTTLCTLAGLVPLALGLGAGAELQRPLAIAVIGGLTLSTGITLLLLPVALTDFTVTGNVPDFAVERAIRLSREKYCSVWHSLRQDLEFDSSFEVRS